MTTPSKGVPVSDSVTFPLNCPVGSCSSSNPYSYAPISGASPVKARATPFPSSHVI